MTSLVGPEASLLAGVDSTVAALHGVNRGGQESMSNISSTYTVLARPFMSTSSRISMQL